MLRMKLVCDILPLMLPPQLLNVLAGYTPHKLKNFGESVAIAFRFEYFKHRCLGEERKGAPLDDLAVLTLRYNLAVVGFQQATGIATSLIR